MRIQKLELVGYKRLLLGNIQSIILVPTSIYQVIIGTNGSGKSSLLRELSPLPASPHDYLSGGSKTIHIEHRGHSYILTSEFTKGSKHFFIKDGEDLNSGNTITVQKELVSREFGYTQDLHEILLGIKTFTHMTPAQRREIITDMSGVNLDYALGVYKDIKTRHRDTQGIIKHLDGRLLTESKKIIATEDIEKLESESKLLKDELTMIMGERGLRDVASETLLNDLKALEDTLIAHSHVLIRTRLESPESGLDSFEAIDARIHSLRQAHAEAQTRLQGYQNEIHSMHEIMEALSHSGSASVDELKHKSQALESEASVLKTQIREFDSIDHAAEITTINREAYALLEPVVVAIPDNDGHFSKTKIADAKATLDQLLPKLDQMQQTETKLSHRIEHIRESKAENCPACGYIWQPGVSENELTTLEGKRTYVLSKLDEIQASIRVQKEYLESAEAYQQSLRRLRSVIDSFPRLGKLWDRVLSSGYANTQPKRIFALWGVWEADTAIHTRLQSIDQQLSEYNQAILYASSLGQSDNTPFGQRIEYLQTQVELSTEASISLRERSESLKRYKEACEQYFRRFEKIAAEQKLLMDTVYRWIEAKRYESLSEVIDGDQTVLAGMNDTLINSYIARDLVKDISNDKLQTEIDNQGYKVLLDVLSPTDGLIAESLKGFIGCMVEQMNGVIANIWTYDLAVLPCGFDSDELDYKFPLQIAGEVPPVSDVSGGSGAQIDIVNFAFKLVVMLYKGMEDYPLYLDELAPTLDEKHRTNITRYVHEFVEQHLCNQLFMISHYHPSFASFINAEICILDSSNIVSIPNVYNQHVTMT